MKPTLYYIFYFLPVLGPLLLLSNFSYGQSVPPAISYTIPSTLEQGQPVFYAPINSGGAVSPAGYIKTMAGNSEARPGQDMHGSALDIYLGLITAMVFDPSGNNLYFYDYDSNVIRKMSPSGDVTAFAGDGGFQVVDGTGSAASFGMIIGMVMDGSGNIYFCEYFDHVVRKITPSGIVTTIAGSAGVPGYGDGPGASALFNGPSGITVDADDNLYVVDSYNHRIRKITPTGVVSTLAGNGIAGNTDGPGNSASFDFTFDTGNCIGTDSYGNVFVTQSWDHTVRKITPAGVVSTYMGSPGLAGDMDGADTNVRLTSPSILTVDKVKDDLYIMQGNKKIRKITSSGQVNTVAGNGGWYEEDGPALDVGFYMIGMMLWMPDGGLLIGDAAPGSLGHYWGFLRRYEKKSYTIEPELPEGLTLGADGVISGTPAGPSQLRTYEITAYNLSGQASTSFSFSIGASGNLLNPDTSWNYVVETTIRESGVTSVSHLQDAPVQRANSSIRYLDGLGRPIQIVQWQGSPDKKDIVQHLEYDSAGREYLKYLPYVFEGIANGSHKMGGSTNVHDFYDNPSTTDIVRTSYPYSETIFENTPMDRVLELGAPGAAWQPRSGSIADSGHTVRMDYGTNANNGVRLWRTTAAGAESNGYYPANRLYRTIAKDENWTSGRAGTVEEYTDFEGRVILKRIWKDENEVLDTYHVYDDFGSLRYVIPPGYTDSTITDNDVGFNEFIYAYRYDGRRRLTEKKLPGKGWEYLVYNRGDQVVLTQDAVQRSKNEWSYVRYDDLGRSVESGLYRNTAETTSTQIRVLAETFSGPLWERRSGGPDYLRTSFPVTGTGITISPLLVSYYDDYGFVGTEILPEQGITRSLLTQTLLTGTKVYKDDGSSPLLTVNYYDDHARLIQSTSQNHLGGMDYVTNTYSFVGELLTSKWEHRVSPAGDITTILTKYDYDHVGRLLTVRHQINTQDEVTLVKNGYNAIGQLVRKSIGGNEAGTAFLDTVTYAYNERSWVKSVNSPHFSYGLHYDDPTQGAIPQYNGNISEQHWDRMGQSAKYFTYSYDKLNRLIDGNSVNGNMREQLTYDDMGNIISLNRDNGTPILYSYLSGGNRLAAVNIPASSNYTYDANGNTTMDRMSMSFTYNHLNLPDSAWNNTVNVGYLYDALGTKLRKYSNQGGNRDYVGGIEYNSMDSIDIIHTGEGIAYSNNDGTYTYRYNLTDHLDNVRAVIYRHPLTDQVEILQQDDYYPFGKQYVVAAGDNKYLYNGKEIQGELGGQYDYGARFYDAEIGRWSVVDPLADHPFQVHLSPYAFSWNNAVRYVDENGLCPECELNVSNPSEGYEYVSQGGALYIYSNGVWTRQGGELEEIVLGGRSTDSRSYSPGLGWDNYFRGPPSGEYGPWKGPRNADEWELTGDILGATEIPGLAQLGDVLSLSANLYKGDNVGIAMSLAALVPGGSQLKLATKGIHHLKKILPGWKKVSINIEHIASGHIKGGSRTSNLKTLFPESMNVNDVNKAVRDAYKNVHSKIQTQGDRMLLRGTTSQGLEIEMWLNKTTKTIETAYPVY